MSWDSAAIGDVCDLFTGGTPDRKNEAFFEGGTVPWLVSGDIHNPEIHSCEGRITELGLANSAAKFLPENSVLIALNGQGKTRGTVAKLKMKATCNQSLVAINPRSSDKLTSEFLFHNLKSRYREIRHLTGSQGDERRGLNMSLIKSIEIPLPPLEEQRRIAAILDQADALRRLRRRALDRLNTLGQAIFHEMFGAGGQTEDMPLSEVVFFQEGPGVRKWQFRDSGIKLINVRNIVNGELVLENTDRYLEENEVAQKYRNFLLDAGDFVVARSGVTWGKIARVSENHLPLCLNTSMIRFRPKDERLMGEYLRSFVEMGSFRSQIERLITGSAQPNFGPSHLKQIIIPVPSLELQKSFEAKIAQLRRQTSFHCAAAAADNKLFASLQHSAFRGEL